jgi:uncharacterized protein (TIGR03790 family)
VEKALQGAAVDSELALVREDKYRLGGWLPNKYFLGYRGEKVKNMPQKVLLVSRLDGPSEEIVRRIVDDSLQTEKKGFRKSLFRCAMAGSGAKVWRCDFTTGIHNATRLVEKSKRMEVVIDAKERLFQPGDCRDAALYCGWYSLAR